MVIWSRMVRTGFEKETHDGIMACNSGGVKRCAALVSPLLAQAACAGVDVGVRGQEMFDHADVALNGCEV